MRNFERRHLQIAVAEGRIRLEEPPFEVTLERLLGGLCRAMGSKILELGVLAQSAQPCDVVAVFVSEEDGRDIFDACSTVSQPLLDFPPTETRIDQNPRFIGLQQGAISCAAATEKTKPKRHPTKEGFRLANDNEGLRFFPLFESRLRKSNCVAG